MRCLISVMACLAIGFIASVGLLIAGKRPLPPELHSSGLVLLGGGATPRHGADGLLFEVSCPPSVVQGADKRATCRLFVPFGK